jgi:hypothetical protein
VYSYVFSGGEGGGEAMDSDQLWLH